MKARWAIVLLLLGTALCMAGTLLVGHAIEAMVLRPLAKRGRFPLTPAQFNWVIMSIYLAFCAGWGWLVWIIMRRSQRNQSRAFEVLPPKE